MLDLFRNPAFGVVPLTDAINKLKFVPGRIGQMGIFRTRSVATTSILLEEKNGILTLVAPTPRGGPGQTAEKPKRSVRSLAVPHFEINDAVMAEEVQGVRAFGQENAVEMVMDKVSERSQMHSQSMDATEEYARLGAVKGIITYADGSTLNLFDEFGVTQIEEIAWDFANKKDGNVRAQCTALYRLMAAELGAVPFSGIHALCGDAYFDALIKNNEVRATYLQQQDAAQLREAYVNNGASGSFGSFNFGGIHFENYRGQVGNTAFVDTDKAHFFPVGAPGLFSTVYAPADYNETVNTMGKRLYEKIYPMQNDKGMHLDVQMNALSYCTRPRVLIKGKQGT
ncbi:major capsid protein [Afipia carboxidovorans]|uniref:major capsid protein n=1 Tax=Afipia carboxidovorans TaxID=40137 RepID=UPI00308B0373|nr:major capsid protein [Afipia carboxidovorans]